MRSFRFATAMLMVGLAATASVGIVIAAGGTQLGCSSPTSSASDAKPVLTDLTTNVILPSYQDVATKADALKGSTAALAGGPSESTLAAAQAAWRETKDAWRRTEAFRFGPVETKSISGAIDYWPGRPATIEQAIAGDQPITVASVDALGSLAKGFVALEYLLFDNVGGNAAILAKLTGEGGARRLQYIAAVAEILDGKTRDLLAAWSPSGENFAKELTDAGGAGALFPSSKAALDQLVNSASFAAELVTNTKIGKPFGKKTGGVPAPEEEESPLSDNSIADMIATLDGVIAVYTGARGGVDGMGVSDLVRAKNASLDDRVVAGLADARAKILAIPAPFRTAITANPAAVETAYQSVRDVKNTMTTEVAGALGTTLKFNDNDGD